MSERSYTQRKSDYFAKITTLVDQYPNLLVVGADNVGSNQMQQIRRALRGKAILLMGKNTMMRRALRTATEAKPELEALIDVIKKNIGLVFVLPSSSMAEVKGLILANKVEAQAKAGAIAPCDVIVPAGPTGLEPTQTAFLQALNIATRIQKGQIEIINDFHLIHEGQKVGNSEATLLQKLNLKPFHYGLTVLHVYEDGFIYSPKVLEISDDEILKQFSTGVQYLAAISLATGYATLASVPHSLANGYASLVAVALETDYVFKQAAAIRARFDNPEAFAAAAPVAAAAAPAAAPAAAAKAAEPSESEDEDMGGGGLFGGDDDW